MPVESDYTVVGMTCGHCVQAVTSEISKISGVRAVTVDLERGAVRVTSDTSIDDELLRAAVDEAGYELVGAGV